MNKIDLQANPPAWWAQLLLSAVPYSVTLSGFGILVAHYPKEKTS